jgi:tetratricopeptide (TPR) repeat protein
MSTYLGNDSLSSAVKERVLSTFQQTVALYKQGRNEEVAAGCGLILRMDPMFDPARKLMEKLKNPSLPIDVDSLLPTAPPPGDRLYEARAALAARDFERAVSVTTEILTDDLMNDEARILNEQAREKMEAAPFVDQFARKCEQHLNANNVPAARAELEKARALDPDHPTLKRIEARIASAAAPAAPSGGFSFDASPSFVVDNAPRTPERGTAHAADFGFTFEEEKQAPAAPKPAAPADAPFGGFSFDSPSPAPSASPITDALSNFSFEAPKPAAPPPQTPQMPAGGFSFDSPAAPSQPASSGFSFDAPTSFAPSPAPDAGPATFDFSTASAETSPDDQRKIQQYLADGDRAADGGDYQQAIDLWSRIFLIDVTNEQASERIERAKSRRREIEAKVETIVAAGVSAYERKDNETARNKFLEALRVDPGNSSAQDYLDRLNDSVTEGGAAGYEMPFEAPAPSTDFLDEELGGSYDAPLEPIAPVAKAKGASAAKSAKPAPSRAGKKSSGGLLAALLAVVVLAGGGWFAYSKFFNKPADDPAATQALLKRADALAAKGKYDQAIAMLQDVKPEDPMHDKAIVMISELQAKRQAAAEMIEGRPAAVYYQENLANARTAFDAHDYDGAKKAFDNAARVKPLPPDMQTMYSTAAQQVAKLDSAKSLFKEGKYQDAIASLDPLLQQDPQNQNIHRMILDAHFNLGAAALQEERLDDAVKEFDDVLKSEPGDELAKRSRELAVRYNGQDKDLLYKIYVKYLPRRKVS